MKRKMLSEKRKSRGLWKSLVRIFEFVLILVTRNQFPNALKISRPKVILWAGFKQ